MHRFYRFVSTIGFVGIACSVLILLGLWQSVLSDIWFIVFGVIFCPSLALSSCVFLQDRISHPTPSVFDRDLHRAE